MADKSSLGELKATIDKHSPDERAALHERMAQADRATWDAEIERDFSPGGAAEKWLQDVDGAIDRGDFSNLP